MSSQTQSSFAHNEKSKYKGRFKRIPDSRSTRMSGVFEHERESRTLVECTYEWVSNQIYIG